MEETLLSNFRAIILEDAKKRSQETLSIYKEKLKDRIKKFEENIMIEEKILLEKETDNIKKKYSAMISMADMDSKKELIIKRGEMEKEVYNCLIKKLMEFSVSEEYKVYLKNKAIEATKIAEGEDIIAEIREKDIKFINDIIKECKVSSDNLGGAKFIIPQKGIILDNTLKSAADDIITNFHEIKIS